MGIYEFPTQILQDQSKTSVLLVNNTCCHNNNVRTAIAGFNIEETHCCSDALSLLDEVHFDCILIDDDIMNEDPLELISKVKLRKKIPILMLCSAADMSVAISGVRAGAEDFVIKELEIGSLSERVLKTIKSKGESDSESGGSSNEVQAGFWMPGQMVVGRSRPMLEATRIARKASGYPATVLILGESGTGKEVFVRWIHKMSKRSEGPFAAVNLAAIPSDLIESTLFGHEKGAFTGSTGSRVGKFGQAAGGTLLLDEVTELQYDLQPKLLRVLQEGEYERVGGDRTLRNDARIIAATNRNVAEMAADGSFRMDLYYRLNIITVHLPALRERKDDIPCLVELFLAKYNKMYDCSVSAVSEQAMECMMDYHWPGNIRELENAIQRAVIVSDGDIIRSLDLGEIAKVESSPATSGLAGHRGTLEDLEKQYIVETLRRTDGHQGQAAKHLGIDRKTLYNKLIRYDLNREVDNKEKRKTGKDLSKLAGGGRSRIV